MPLFCYWISKGIISRVGSMHSTEETGVLGWDHLPSWEQGRIHTNSYLSGIFFWFLGFCVRHWTPLNELTKIALILLMLFPPCSALPILQAGPGFPPVNTRDQEMAVGFLTAGSQVSCASALSVLMTLLWMRFTFPRFLCTTEIHPQSWIIPPFLSWWALFSPFHSPQLLIWIEPTP